jgi:hypothetical protein
MSIKEQYIEQAREARIEHKKWVNQVRLIVSGLETHRDAIALNPSSSPFGEWLYSKAMSYTISNSKLVLGELELLFDKCYEEYHKIYSVLFQDKDSSILASFFGTKKASSSDYKIASQHYETLLMYSDKLLSKMQIFENQLSATSFEKFERVLQELPPKEKEEAVAPKQKEQRYYRGSLIEE